MSIALRRLVRLGLPLAAALVCTGIASAAPEPQLVCIELISGVAGTTPVVFHLNATFPGNNTVSFVGTEDQGTEHRVATGGGALIAGQAEVSLLSTDIAATLVGTSTHVILTGPTFATGTFKSAQARGSQTVTLSEGTAFIVDCATK